MFGQTRRDGEGGQGRLAGSASVWAAGVMSSIALRASPTVLCSSEKKLYQDQDDVSVLNTLIYILIYGTRSLLWVLVYILQLVFLSFPLCFFFHPVSHPSDLIYTHSCSQDMKTRTIDFISVSDALKRVGTVLHKYSLNVFAASFLKVLPLEPRALSLYVKDFAALFLTYKHIQKPVKDMIISIKSQ